jgi:release factor glutamine methyltransferase
LQPSPTAALDADLLLAHLLGISRASLLAHRDQPLTREQRQVYGRLIANRKEGVPVAYLRGAVSWLDLELEVSPDVLVPRPETELMVELAEQTARERQARTLLDIGTGSGAIAIALARALPHAHLLAVDLSRRALLLAHRNVTRYGLSERIQLFEGDLLAPIIQRPDLITANLPYLDDQMMEELDLDVRQEPALALHGGPTGLDLYERVFRTMAERGWYVPIFTEIDPRQAEAMTALARSIFPLANVRLVPDLTGRVRVAIVEPGGDR